MQNVIWRLDAEYLYVIKLMFCYNMHYYTSKYCIKLISVNNHINYYYSNMINTSDIVGFGHKQGWALTT